MSLLLLSSIGPYLLHTNVGPVRLPQFSEFVMWNHSISLVGVVFLVSSISQASSFTGFSDPCREGFDGCILSVAEGSSISYFLPIIWLWVSVFASICHRGKLPWRWLSRALIIEYSRISLGVILLFCSFSRIKLVLPQVPGLCRL